MAIYHCSIKTVSRSAGRSATSAAAYRAAEKITDERTGETHDYTRKTGVEYTQIITPLGMESNRSELWNAAEKAENRRNSTVAREYEIALPEELDENQRQDLAVDFAFHLATTYGVAADVAIHAPHKKGDSRNYHAHILTTTRKVLADGSLGEKTRSLDERKSGEVERIRETWADLCNQTLERAGHSERVSHKSLESQGIERVATIHIGPRATAMERRGIKTDLGEINRKILEIEQKIKQVETKKETLQADIKAKTPKPEPKPKTLEEQISDYLNILDQQIEQKQYFTLEAYENNEKSIKEAAKPETDFYSDTQHEAAKLILNERFSAYMVKVRIAADKEINSLKQELENLEVNKPKSIFKGQKYKADLYSWEQDCKKIREYIESQEKNKKPDFYQHQHTKHDLRATDEEIEERLKEILTLGSRQRFEKAKIINNLMKDVREKTSTVRVKITILDREKRGLSDSKSRGR